MGKYTTQKASELAQRLVEQRAENDRKLAGILAEQAAHDKKMEGILNTSGLARVAFVEELLEALGINPVPHEQRRNKRTGAPLVNSDGTAKMFNPDPDEMQRMELLAQVIEGLMEQTGAAEESSITEAPATSPVYPSINSSRESFPRESETQGSSLAG